MCPSGPSGFKYSRTKIMGYYDEHDDHDGVGNQEF